MTIARHEGAITGLGLVTALGRGVEANWEALRAGRSGARTITAFDTRGLLTQFAAYVESKPGQSHVFPRARVCAMLIDVVSEALRDADIGPEALAQCRSRLFVATPHSEVYLQERLRLRAPSLDRERHQVERNLHLSVMVGSIGAMLKKTFGIGGIPINVNTACASSASAIQLAFDCIRRNEIDVAVVATADASIYPEGLVRFSLLSALSTRNAEPERASRPFSRGRDGFVMGEGGAALVVEAPSFAAARRNRAPHAFLIGVSDATDNFHRTRSHPSGDAILRCMSEALKDARLTEADIGYINAHGTSTPENDKMESLGIVRLLGARVTAVPVSSNKSMIGHTLCAAGAIEATITSLSLRDGYLPPTINNDEPDPDIPLDVVPNVGRETKAVFAMSNSFGFGGQNVSLILRGAGAP